MDILRTADQLRQVGDWGQAHHKRVGFIPTMGALHQGHLSLVQASKTAGDELVVASIFVNPLQFGKNEDLDRYPRDEAGDLAKLEGAGVDCVFLPSVAEMYPSDFRSSVEVSGLTEPLCGRSRPGHFRGVTTVLARLLGMVRPSRLYMGLKDYQQARVTARMVQDLELNVEVVGVPTLRESDGLAMSSRNLLLSPEGRQVGPVLYQALLAANALYVDGERDPRVLESAARTRIEARPTRIDYVEVVDAEHLGVPSPDRPMVMALAVFVGQTRLIDNLMLGPRPEHERPISLCSRRALVV